MAIKSYENKVDLVPSVLETLVMQGVGTAPLVELCKTRQIYNSLHSWISDRYEDASDNANAEITGFSDTAKKTKVETINHTQIFTTNVSVSYRQNALKQYTGNELAHQISKKMIKHKKDIEFAMLGLGRDAIDDKYVPMSDTENGRMASIFFYVPKEHRKDFLNAGKKTNFTFKILQSIIEPIWLNGGIDDGKFKIFLGSSLKQKINDWLDEKPSLKVEVKGGEIDPRVTKIHTDFGVVDIYLHRLFSAEEKLQDKVLAGNFNDVSLCYLTPTKVEDVSTDKTAILKRIYSDLLLEVKNPDMFASASGLA